MKKKLLLVVLFIVFVSCMMLAACDLQPTEPDGWGKVFTCETAYAEAQSLGYTGTLQEFMDSIKGKDGTNGIDGKDGIGIKSVVVNEQGNLVITLSDDTTQTIEHKWKVCYTLVEVSCITDGKVLYECEDCSLVKVVTIAKSSHTDGEWITDVEPDCTNPGSKHQVCSVCGETIKTESIKANGHSYSEEVISPTCITQGYTLHTCSACKDAYKDNYVPTNGEHNFQESNTCAYCQQDINDVAVDSYNMSKTDADNVKTYVIPRADGNYDAYVKGMGVMKDYDNSSNPFQVDCYTIVNAYIENGITAIGNYLFLRCDFTNVSIPDSVINIGNGAFYCCESLTTVKFEKDSQVTTLGESAFYYCESLTNITIPKSVTSIGKYAFQYCSSLANVKFEEDSRATTIGYSAFNSCNHLESIIIPNSITSIDALAFYYCTQLTNIAIEGTPEIGTNTFIGTAYYNNSNNWHNKVLYVDNCLIEAKTTIATYVVKNGTKVIGNSAFHDCSSLTSVTIPNSVKIVGSFAFDDCSSLESITIPCSVTSIGCLAFANCSNLTSVTFEDPNGWFITETPSTTSGTNLTLTDAEQNAKYLKNRYRYHYWYKSTNE